MHILFYLGHPAHFYLFRNTILELKKRHRISILSKKKDILDQLLKNAGFDYINILPEGRNNSKISILYGMLKREVRLLKYCSINRPDIMVGTSPDICQVGKLLGIPSINLNEDDAAAVPHYANFSYPFATEVLTPSSCNNGKWESKSLKYESYHELAYLHPEVFSPDIEIVKKKYQINNPYYILRFASLNAHHDKGIKGISNELAITIIDNLSKHGTILITSERKMESDFERFRLNINPLDIHHVLYYADLYIGDSQTMAAEAAVLGTPSLRYNDFVGKLGYLEELEHHYHLTYGFKTGQESKLLAKIQELLNLKDIKTEWNNRKSTMLNDKINLSQYLIHFLEEYTR